MIDEFFNENIKKAKKHFFKNLEYGYGETT